MRLPKMSDTQRAVFGALYAAELSQQPQTIDNAAAENALEQALEGLANFRIAVRRGGKGR